MLRLRNLLRFTLGELLLVALSTGVGMAALRSGGLLAAAYLFSAVVLLTFFLVAAIDGRGALRSFAIGLLVGIAVYGGVLYWYGEEEFDPEHGELLTTRVAKPLYAAVQEVYFVNAFNGREATVEEAEAASRQPLVSISHWSPNIINVSFGDREKIARVGNDFWTPVVRPDVREFMQVVHLLAALTLGYVAGKFNAALYRRRRALPAGNGVREPVVREGEASSPTPAAETDSPR